MKPEPQIHDDESWIAQFTSIYTKASTKFSDGIRGADSLFTNEDSTFLKSIGATNQEIYDFIEDWIEAGEPDPESVLGVTAIRRDYFFREQAGIHSETTISMKDLPSMGATLGGYRWLPRIIVKAQAKLKGEMPSALMYGCGGDRPFLKGIGIKLDEFLQVVRQAKDNTQEILDYVKLRSSGPTAS